MRGRLIGCCAWLAGTAMLCCAQNSDPGQQHLRVAAQAAADGRIAAAMAATQAALVDNPNAAPAWYQLGTLLGQSGDFTGAESALRHSLQLDPSLAKAHYGLALTLVGNPQAKQDWSGAITECREALKWQPKYAEALNLLGAALNNIGQPAAAIESLQQSIALSPALAEAHFNLALALESLAAQTHAQSSALLDQAAQQYGAAMQAKGAYPEAGSALGKLLLRRGENAAAEQQERTALRLNPDLTDAHYTLARIFRAEKRTRDATAEFAEAQELTERPSLGLQSAQISNQAMQLAAKGDLSGAIPMLRKAIQLKPDYGVPHYNLGLILADTGDLGAAIKELSKAISLLPGQAKPWFDLGRVQELAKNGPDALADVTYAAYLAPSDQKIQAEAASLRNDHLAHLGDTAADGTLPARQPAVGAATDTAAGHLAFAGTLQQQADFEGAAGELLRALTLEPANIDARRALAEVCERLGEDDRAVLEYRKIVLSAPADASANLAIGRILLKAGDKAGAVDQLQKAVQWNPGSIQLHAALEGAEETNMPSRIQ